VSRLRRIANRDRIFFVTTNLERGLPSIAPHERDLVIDQLGHQRRSEDFFLFAFVVMPTHVHLLLAPNLLGLTASMHRLKRFAAEGINRRRGTQGPLWQSRYFDFIPRRVSDFWEKLEYIHNNPVQANLASTPQEWYWSSAAYYFDTGRPPVLVDPVDLPADRDALLWPAPWR
jgi:putative transposase